MHPLPPILHLDDTQITVIIAGCALVILDIISGLAKAWATDTISSKAMRSGLWHKSGYAVVMALSVIIDEAQRHIDLGISVPVTTAAGTYIILTEVTSILENAAAINPDLGGGQLAKIFHTDKINQTTQQPSTTEGKDTQ